MKEVKSFLLKGIKAIGKGFIGFQGLLDKLNFIWTFVIETFVEPKRYAKYKVVISWAFCFLYFSLGLVYSAKLGVMALVFEYFLIGVLIYCTKEICSYFGDYVKEPVCKALLQFFLSTSVFMIICFYFKGVSLITSYSIVPFIS